ncbi:MAG: glycerol kinase GlpK, partial [Nitrososphaerota archaeon]
MYRKFVIGIDQGTTNTKSIVLDMSGEVISIAKSKLKRFHPRHDWVEQRPEDIWKTTLISLKRSVQEKKIPMKKIECIGIADQGETIILWDKNTGIPVYNAIVWQDRRTTETLRKIEQDFPDVREEVRKRTGLMLDPYFSASKIKWILDNVENAREKALKGELIMGTTDTWLVWNLTKGRLHVTDYTTASRTMLFNINSLKWDEVLLETFGIPAEILPEVAENANLIGYTDCSITGSEIPISNLIVDQQAALFGHMCFQEKEVKATYGTGVFILMNIGNSPTSAPGILTTIAWVLGKQTTYAFDGGSYYAGALIDYLTENFKIIKNPKAADKIARSVESSGGLYFVPAIVGLAAPYWDTTARGLIIGLNPSSTYKHLVRAAVEGIALSVYDVIEEMSKAIGGWITNIKADGGLTQNSFLMQFQADILDVPLYSPSNQETTAYGTALLAGIARDVFPKKLEELRRYYKVEKMYRPQMEEHV